MLERRQGTRYPLNLPAQVRWKAAGKGAGEVQGTTGDISSTGLLVVLPKPLPVGTTINVTMNLPPEVTTVPIELSCVARVVRKSRTASGEGISAIIEDFQLRPVRHRLRKRDSGTE